MDKNNSNKKLKLKQRVAESNVEHDYLLWEGNDNRLATNDNVATTTVNIEQSNASKVGISIFSA